MSDLIGYAVGKQAPQEIVNQLSQLQGDRVFLGFSESGSPTAFIVIRNIKKWEVNDKKGDLTLIYQPFKIPFLVLSYKKSSFEMPITKKIEGNALAIILIDENGYIVKNLRMLGVEPKIIEAINKKVKELGSVQLMHGVTEVYNQYSAEEMLKGGMRQHFA